eukprot:SAG31_NODE_734_length_12489_cov_6.922034_6_plen_41_part_00
MINSSIQILLNIAYILNLVRPYRVLEHLFILENVLNLVSG